MKQIPASILTLVAGVLVALISLWYGQNHGLLPEQASVQALLIDSMFNLMVTMSTALMLIVLGALVVFIIQFRHRPGDDGDGIPIEGSLSLEAFWTLIPAVLIIILAVYSVDIFQQLGGFNPGDHAAHMAMMQSEEEAAIASEPSGNTLPTYGLGTSAASPQDLVVDVTGIQYAWLFNYPDSGIVSGELHVPIGQEVQLKLAANDVIHSFWVPQFRLKQDAIPGEKTELHFTANKVGTYPIVCAELCGAYHGGMRSQVIVHTPEDYQQWVQQNTVAHHSASPTAIALSPTEKSPTQFLAPYAQEMQITAEELTQLPHHPSMN